MERRKESASAGHTTSSKPAAGLFLPVTQQFKLLNQGQSPQELHNYNPGNLNGQMVDSLTR
jgi:hypothetical protein